MSFWSELKRRNVVKVGVAYAIVAWLIIQAVDTIFPVLQLPEWAVTLVTVLLIIGFPLALLFAWAFELTPDGIKLTKEVPHAESITHLTGKKLNYILAGLLILAVGYIVIDKYFITPRAVEPEQAPVVAEVEEAPKTIAVLPFVDISPEKDQEYFVDGLSEELLNCLTKIEDLSVTSRTSAFSFKGKNKTVQEIASILGVAHILEGSVRKAGNTLRVTAQLVRAADDRHLWSDQYDRELKDIESILSVQEDIAKAVANELKVKLGVGESLKQLGGTDNLEAYELYLVAKGQLFGIFSIDLFNRALKSIDAVIALDPKFALAWAAKAHAHSYLVIFGPANRAVSELDAALNAAERAIELEPKLGAGYYQLGWVKTNKGEWIEAESAYRKALELITEPLSGDEFFIAVYYYAVGNFKKAHELLEEIRQNDLLNRPVRACYMLNLAFLGDTQRAEDEYERCMGLFEGQWPIGDNYITWIRQGYSDVVSSDIVYSSPVYNSVKEHLDSAKEGLGELHRIYINANNLSSEELAEIGICAAFFGDPEFALDAIEKALSIQTSGAFCLWFPVLKEVRQLPRFKEYIKEIGLVDYWNHFGWPDICRPLDNGDFECD